MGDLLDGIARLNTATSNMELINVLRSKKADLKMKERAIVQLGDHKYGPAVPYLIALLKHPKEVIRSHSITSLGKIGAQQAFKQLKHIAESGSMQERVHAISALAQIGGPEAIAVAEGSISDDNPAVREISAYVLGKLQSKTAVNKLIHALGDDTEMVKVAAAIALGEIGEKSAIGPLTAKLEGEISEDFRVAVSTSIKKLAGL